MKTYHIIEKYSEIDYGKHIHAFDKIDGSNFRAEWDRKLSKKSRFTMGFKKFGTRNEIISKNNPFVEAVGIFENKYAEDLDQIFKDNKTFRGIDRITVYGEFYGMNSFAGIHDWKESHDVVMFDLFLYKKGFLSPVEFIKIFSKFDIPIVRYKGLLTEDYIESVKESNLNEGIVYKGVENGKVFMGKIKTNEWLEKVKEKLGIEEMLKY